MIKNAKIWRKYDHLPDPKMQIWPEITKIAHFGHIFANMVQIWWNMGEIWWFSSDFDNLYTFSGRKWQFVQHLCQFVRVFVIFHPFLRIFVHFYVIFTSKTPQNSPKMPKNSHFGQFFSDMDTHPHIYSRNSENMSIFVDFLQICHQNVQIWWILDTFSQIMVVLPPHPENIAITDPPTPNHDQNVF